MDPNLIIEDAYIKEVGRCCLSRGRKLESILDTYVGILDSIRGGAIKKGEIAQALSVFKSCATLLNDQLSVLSQDIKNECYSFIDEVDEADNYLF